MAVTPLLLKLDDYLETLRTQPAREFDSLEEEHNQVIIAGFGRFGQITGRLLRAKKIPFTALDINPDQIDFVRKFGNKAFYGDASRLDLLRSAHADKASIFVLAIDDIEASLKTAEIVTSYFPNLTVYARARNRNHAYKLMDMGIKILRRETFASALEIAGLVLSGLGMAEPEVRSSVNRFKEHDIKRLHEHQTYHTDEEKMIALAKSAAKELEELFAADNNGNKSV
jgi:voltage-gated potassium channel Kch